MKKLMLWIAVLAALPVSALFAQDVTGTWQGTLHAGRDLRTVVKVSKDDGVLKAMFYSIDQGGQGLSAKTFTLQGSAVKMTLPLIDGTYEGKLSADGNSITGTWTQGGAPGLPLNLTKATTDAAWTIPDPPAKLKPMAADAKPVFEVATIKPSEPGKPGKGFLVRGRHFSTINTSLTDLLTFAYGVHAHQITGGPDWMSTDKYDLDAQPDGEGQPNDKQWKAMVQKLVADRFKLTFHHDKKELTAYTIVIGKTGSKLTKSDGDPDGLPGLFFRGLGKLTVRNATMVDFAGLMQSAVLDRPVIDKSGLPGRYDFTLNWTPDENQFGGMGIKPPPPADTADAPPDLFTAMQEQLGLKFQTAKEPVDVLVIDKVEKPSAN